MSTLVLVLTAAMAVPGNGPEMVSVEIEPPGLDLSGEWEGTLEGGSSDLSGELQLTDGLFQMRGKKGVWHGFAIVHESEGYLTVSVRGSLPLLGIYKWKNDELLICYSTIPNGQRPKTFRASDDQEFLILHRVKPRK
ncbi:MAG TPA: hypothetical protein VH643_23570 [Gemmataceae bacterium]|jgi:hypothetical protein